MEEQTGQVNFTGDQGQQAPGWIAGLPDDLKGNETFTQYKTVGEFAKAHIETATKAKELERKLESSIPRLPDDATEEERNIYFNELGRPEKPEQYEFEGEDKNAPEWTNMWKQTFHKLGVPAATAKELSKEWNGQMQKLVETHNANVQKEISTAAEKLKAELGDKYDATVELTKRFFNDQMKDVDGADFDKCFTGETSATRYMMIKFLSKIAAKTGEDTSLQGRPGQITKGGSTGDWFPNSPPSPTGR